MPDVLFEEGAAELFDNFHVEEAEPEEVQVPLSAHDGKKCKYVFLDTDTIVCREHTNPHYILFMIPERRERVINELRQRGELA